MNINIYKQKIIDLKIVPALFIRQMTYMTKPTVEHVESIKQFRMMINGAVASIEYTKRGNVLHLNESFVPASLRGKGYGHILAQDTFEYANNNNLKVKIGCSFIQKVFDENLSKYKHLLLEKK